MANRTDKLISQNTAVMTSLLELLRDESTQRGERAKKQEDAAEKQEKQNELDKQYNKIIAEQNDLLDENNKEKSALKKIEEDLKEAVKAANEAEIERIKGLRLAELNTQKLEKETQKLKEETEALTAGLEEQASTWIQATLGIRSASKVTTDLIKRYAEGKKVLGTFNKEVFGANLALGAAVSITQKFAEATFSAYKTSQQLQLTLGRELGIATTAGELDNILTAAQNSANAAVSFETLGNAVGQLQRSTRGLLGNIAENNLELALFTDEMRTVGVETQTSAELFGNFALILGKEGVGQAKNLETSLVKLARTNGLASDQMVKDIAEITDQLAQFGDRADDIGLEIAKISTFTKIGAKNIADFAQGFEYLPDAVEKANQLNLAFQSNLVSGRDLFEMMNDGRGPAEVMKTVLGAVGTQIDETFLKSPYKVRALAESLGVSRAEAMNLGKEMIAARNSGKSLNQVIDEQAQKAEGNAKALEAVTNIQDKLGKLQEKFAIAISPVVDLLGSLLDIVNGLPAPVIKGIGVAAVGAFTAISVSLFRTAAALQQLAINAASASSAAGGGGLGGAGKFRFGGMKGVGLAAVGTLAAQGLSYAAGGQEKGSTAQKALGIGAGALQGAAMGAMLGPWGAAIGALIGGGGAALSSMDDGVIIAQGGKMKATKINSQDQVSLMAGKPGGPLSRAGGTDAVEIVVNLFGQELVRKMVDLVEGEQGKRKQISDAVAGGA